MEKLCAKYVLENSIFNFFELENMNEQELKEFEEMVIDKYELKLVTEEYKNSLKW